MSYLEKHCKVIDGELVIAPERLERDSLCKEVIHDGGQGCDHFEPRARCCGMCKAWTECAKHGMIPCYPVRELEKAQRKA